MVLIQAIVMIDPATIAAGCVDHLLSSHQITGPGFRAELTRFRALHAMWAFLAGVGAGATEGVGVAIHIQGATTRGCPLTNATGFDQVFLWSATCTHQTRLRTADHLVARSYRGATAEACIFASEVTGLPCMWPSNR